MSKSDKIGELDKRDIPPVTISVERTDWFPVGRPSSGMTDESPIERLPRSVREGIPKCDPRDVGKAIAKLDAKHLAPILGSDEDISSLCAEAVQKLVEDEGGPPHFEQKPELQRTFRIDVVKGDLANLILATGRVAEFPDHIDMILEIGDPGLVDQYRTETAESVLLDQGRSLDAVSPSRFPTL